MISSPSGIGGYLLQPWLVPLLGTWHIYKQASLQVYRAALRHFLSGLFHVLFPQRKVYAKPKLVQITNVLSLVRLSYPSWADDLKQALGNHKVKAVETKHLLNLQVLVGWLIPVVCADFNRSCLWSLERLFLC